MLARDHLTAALPTALLTAAVVWRVPRLAFVHDVLMPWDTASGAASGVAYACAGLCALAMLAGSILPDIDHPTSVLGRFVPLHGRHRSVTHSLWALAAVAVGGVVLSRHDAVAGAVVCWIVVGMFWHDLFDSVGHAPVAWLYPLGNYRVVSLSGTPTVIANRRPLGLYVTAAHAHPFCSVMTVLCLVGAAVLAWPWLAGEVPALSYAWDWLITPR